MPNQKPKVNKKDNKQDQVTFDSFDKLKLKFFAERLIQVMEKGVNSSVGEKGSYTVSLNAEFGNGKTTFLKMFEHFIKNEKNQNYNLLSINAWESDFYPEPVIAILSELSYHIKDHHQKIYREIKKTMGQIAKFGLHIGGPNCKKTKLVLIL